MLVSLVQIPFAQAESSHEVLWRLQSELRRHPNDVDLQLKVAIRLSWIHKWAEARHLALKVLKRSPRYWDAHLLIARLDGWEKKCDAAQTRAEAVRRSAPDPGPALKLLADLSVWCRQPGSARQALTRLLKKGPSAKLYYRLAQVEHQVFHDLRAYLLVRKALALDPLDQRARDLARQIPLAAFTVVQELEAYPAMKPSFRLGYGSIVTATALPQAWLGFTLQETYRHRFGTDNNQLMFQVDWRHPGRFRVALIGGFGLPAHVISRATGEAILSFPLGALAEGAVTYRYDSMPWSAGIWANLHRGRVDAGLKLGGGFRAEGAFTLGALAPPGDTKVIYATQLRLSWQRKMIRLSFQYGFGTEVERRPLDGGFLGLLSHTLSAQIRYAWSRWWISGGYAFQVRDVSGPISMAHDLNLGIGTQI